MYPPNARSALVSQLETEAVMRELTMTTYRHWLPHVRAAVLPHSLTAAGELPPTAAGVAATQQLWEYYLDMLMMYGIRLTWAGTALDTYAALGGAVRDLPTIGLRPLPAGTGVAPEEPATLGAEVRQVVSRVLGKHLEAVDDLERRLAALPELDTMQAYHGAGVRDRLKDTPDTVFRSLTKDLDEGIAANETPFDLEKRVQERLSEETGDWKGRARTIARTESAALQSSASIEAARLRNTELGEDLTQVWIATMDSVTRPTHRAAHGQRTEIGGQFTVGTASLRFPGDPKGPADEVVNCRCATAVLAADEELPEADDTDYDDEDDLELTESLVAHGNQQMGTDVLEKVREAPQVSTYRSFSSVLAVLGELTDDGRMLAADMDFRFRDFPLPLMWQKQSSEGHFQSVAVGVLEEASVADSKVVGSGYFLDTPEADEAASQVGHGITGPSVDLGDAEWELTDADGNSLSEDALWDLGFDAKVITKFTSAKLLGATLVATPAFGTTSITMGEDVERGESVEAIVASAAAVFTEVTYPDRFFADPGFTSPALPQVDSDGHVKGHLALWNTCHTGIQDRCVMAPRSATSYAYFHTSPPVLTTSGKRIKVGRLTVGTGHADRRLQMWPAAEHYDNTGTCFARVHIGEDAHGIWFAGVIERDVDMALVRKGIAAPLSGDWRSVGGSLELVAALAVNTPGFPVLASGATDSGDEPLSLVASLGPCREDRGFDYKALAAHAVREMRRAVQREVQAKELVEQVMSKRRTEAANLIARVGSTDV